MYFPKTNEHTVPFNRAEIPPLHYENLSELIQDVKNVSAPTNMRRLFAKMSEVQSYDIRFSPNSCSIKL